MLADGDSDHDHPRSCLAHPLKPWPVESRCPIADEDWRHRGRFPTYWDAETLAANLRGENGLWARVVKIDEEGRRLVQGKGGEWVRER